MLLSFIVLQLLLLAFFFFFNDTATTEIYTLSLHDALPISRSHSGRSTAAPSWRSRRPNRAALHHSCRRAARPSARPRLSSIGGRDRGSGSPPPALSAP